MIELFNMQCVFIIPTRLKIISPNIATFLDVSNVQSRASEIVNIKFNSGTHIQRRYYR